MNIQKVVLIVGLGSVVVAPSAQEKIRSCVMKGGAVACGVGATIAVICEWLLEREKAWFYKIESPTDEQKQLHDAYCARVMRWQTGAAYCVGGGALLGSAAYMCTTNQRGLPKNPRPQLTQEQVAGLVRLAPLQHVTTPEYASKQCESLLKMEAENCSIGTYFDLSDQLKRDQWMCEGMTLTSIVEKIEKVLKSTKEVKETKGVEAWKKKADLHQKAQEQALAYQKSLLAAFAPQSASLTEIDDDSTEPSTQEAVLSEAELCDAVIAFEKTRRFLWNSYQTQDTETEGERTTRLGTLVCPDGHDAYFFGYVQAFAKEKNYLQKYYSSLLYEDKYNKYKRYQGIVRTWIDKTVAPQQQDCTVESFSAFKEYFLEKLTCELNKYDGTVDEKIKTMCEKNEAFALCVRGVEAIRIAYARSLAKNNARRLIVECLFGRPK